MWYNAYVHLIPIIPYKSRPNFQKERFIMPLVTTKEMFEKAYNGGYAIGAFNVNNM